MVAFLESRIDSKITRGTEFEIEQPSRRKIYAIGGQLEQSFGDTPPRHSVNLSHGVRSKADFQTLVDAFYVVLFTPYTGLRVKNWNDFQLTKANSAVASLGAGVYQMQRRHIFGGVTFLRNIYKPVASSVVVYDSGDVALTSTIDTTAGTFTVVSGTPSYCIGDFDLPMTFTDDKWRATLDVHTNNLHMVNEPIMLEEILL